MFSVRGVLRRWFQYPTTLIKISGRGWMYVKENHMAAVEMLCCIFVVYSSDSHSVPRWATIVTEFLVEITHKRVQSELNRTILLITLT